MLETLTDKELLQAALRLHDLGCTVTGTPPLRMVDRDGATVLVAYIDSPNEWDVEFINTRNITHASLKKRVGETSRSRTIGGRLRSSLDEETDRFARHSEDKNEGLREDK